MGPFYLGKMGTFVNFRYINNLAVNPPITTRVQNSLTYFLSVEM